MNEKGGAVHSLHKNEIIFHAFRLIGVHMPCCRVIRKFHHWKIFPLAIGPRVRGSKKHYLGVRHCSFRNPLSKYIPPDWNANGLEILYGSRERNIVQFGHFLGGVARRTIKSFHTIQEKSLFVLLEFINFELVIQCEYVKQLGKNKCTNYVIMIVFSDWLST